MTSQLPVSYQSVTGTTLLSLTLILRLESLTVGPDRGPQTHWSLQRQKNRLMEVIGSLHRHASSRAYGECLSAEAGPFDQSVRPIAYNRRMSGVGSIDVYSPDCLGNILCAEICAVYTLLGLGDRILWYRVKRRSLS
ncbi:hypothetical protein K474DRAFT_1669702, partial [Panus rudis PR-1116 ss-1]